MGIHELRIGEKNNVVGDHTRRLCVLLLVFVYIRQAFSCHTHVSHESQSHFSMLLVKTRLSPHHRTRSHIKMSPSFVREGLRRCRNCWNETFRMKKDRLRLFSSRIA